MHVETGSKATAGGEDQGQPTLRRAAIEESTTCSESLLTTRESIKRMRAPLFCWVSRSVVWHFEGRQERSFMKSKCTDSRGWKWQALSKLHQATHRLSKTLRQQRQGYYVSQDGPQEARHHPDSIWADGGAGGIGGEMVMPTSADSTNSTMTISGASPAQQNALQR